MGTVGNRAERLLIVATESADIEPEGQQLRCRRRYLMSELLMSLWQEDKGQDLTEYALLLVLIALVAIAAMQFFGSAVSSVFSNASVNVTTATS